MKSPFQKERETKYFGILISWIREILEPVFIANPFSQCSLLNLRKKIGFKISNLVAENK